MPNKVSISFSVRQSIIASLTFIAVVRGKTV